MPEGPSIVILREAAAKFRNRTVREVGGNSKLDLRRMHGRRVVSLRSWGKHFLIGFRGFSLRAHLLMFGSWLIDAEKDATPRVSLRFDNGTLNLYACSLKYIEGPLEDTYDWRGDVMAPEWDPELARRKLRQQPEVLVCDALLDQDVFAGVGNIIKNEVLFRIRVHPASEVGALPPRLLGRMIREGRDYSFQFLEWNQRYVLRQHWLVHNKSQCAECGVRSAECGGMLTRQHMGARNRRTFYCERCQPLYPPPA